MLPSTPQELQNIDPKDVSKDIPYASLVCALLYIARCTRPDIMFAVNFLCRSLTKYTEEHYKAALRVLQYLKGTRTMKLRYVKDRTKPSGKLGNSKIDGLNFARLEETKFRTEKKKFRPENCRILPCGTLWPGSPGKRRFFLLVVLHLVCPYTLVLEMYFLHRSQRRVFARSWRPRKTTDRNVIVRRVALHTTIRRCH